MLVEIYFVEKISAIANKSSKFLSFSKPELGKKINLKIKSFICSCKNISLLLIIIDYQINKQVKKEISKLNILLF